MEEVDEIQAVGDSGFAGCAHARGGNRQVLLLDLETLEAMDLKPGILRENITSDDLNIKGLAIGQHLKIGEAHVEVSMVCTPCDLMETIRPGLREELWGRRGVFCRVLEAGVVRRGDAIQKLPQAPASEGVPQR